MRVNLLASNSPEGTAAQGGTIPSQSGRSREPAFSHGLIDDFHYTTISVRSQDLLAEISSQ